LNLSQAVTLYTLAQRARVQIALVAHAELKSFTLNLRTFERQLGEEGRENYWRPKLRLLKGYRFRLCSTPLPFDEPSQDYKKRFKDLYQELIKCDRIYPQFAEQARNLVRQAQLLTSASGNPILEQIHTLGLPDKSALLIKESRFVDSLEILLSKILELRHLRVVTAPQLRDEEVFDHLVIVGPMRWFPDYVVTAPRGRSLLIVRYGFLGDGWEPRVSFIPQKNRPPRLPIIPPSNEPETEVVNADELVPTIDWDAVAAQMSRQTSSDQEFVDARLFVLEDDKAVFLEVDASELVIDTRSEEVVRRVKVERLEPGLFLIVRERGSGDYIVPLANRLLGEHASPARETQKHWKGELRRAVSIKGMDHVLNGLKWMGARSASPQNIRNWMSRSDRKIRPRYAEDFQAIMRYLDLLDNVEDYWKNARRINKAHHMAGIRMKELLLVEVKKSNLGRLEQRGHQSFAFAEYETHIHAYRIIEMKPSPKHVPLSEVGTLLEL